MSRKQIILYSVTILIISCNPISKAVKTFNANPEQAALYCAVTFPVKDSIIKGDTVVINDTVTNTIVDSVKVDCPPNSEKVITITKACPPGKTITVTKVITDTVIRRDIAKETVLSNALTESQTTVTKVQGQYEAMKDKRDKWRLWFWILLGAAGAYTFLKIKRIIPF
jgi:hypothetical protein